MEMSYCSKRFSRAISTESRNPSVTRSAVFAPVRSMRALVARVVPWMRRSISPGAIPAVRIASPTAATTPTSGASGVVSTLAVTMLSPPPVSRATSVNVPPTSTARRQRPRD